MDFYRVYAIYHDGQEIEGVIISLTFEDAILEAQRRIDESISYGDEIDDNIDEIVFWNEELDEPCCSVTFEEVVKYDTPIATIRGEDV